MHPHVSPPRDTPFAKTRAIVAALADAIAAGDVEPSIAELRALAQLCDQRHLPLEAARIRRWLAT